MSAAANDTTRSDEHGIAGAYYSLHYAPLSCTLECTCGETFGGHTWAEAGEELDEHLIEHGHDLGTGLKVTHHPARESVEPPENPPAA